MYFQEIKSKMEIKTALAKCLQELEKCILDHRVDIEEWFQKKWQSVSLPIYGSIDLRNAGFKLAPVDMNLFPAGFNNLNKTFLPLSVQALQKTIKNYNPHITKILLIPENHTRNIPYLESLCTLRDIAVQAGFNIKIGTLNKEIASPLVINLSYNRKITLEPITRKGDKIWVDKFSPDFIWLNNDLSSGIPAILQGISQEIKPPMRLGWSQRLKSKHFACYEKIAKEFAQLIGIDSWLINPLFSQAEGVDFLKSKGMDGLVVQAESLLSRIKQKYQEYEIKQDPFLVVKADMGTYGMSVMTINNLNELKNLNRKQRVKMSSAKGGNIVKQVILQEGVYTFETIGSKEAVAEPVIYMIGQYVIGGFYRAHEKKGVTDNLNSPGMHFEQFMFTQHCGDLDQCLGSTACINRFYIYGVIARLSLLAAVYEQEEQRRW